MYKAKTFITNDLPKYHSVMGLQKTYFPNQHHSISNNNHCTKNEVFH